MTDFLCCVIFSAFFLFQLFACYGVSNILFSAIFSAIFLFRLFACSGVSNFLLHTHRDYQFLILSQRCKERHGLCFGFIFLEFVINFQKVKLFLADRTRSDICACHLPS